MVAQELPFSQTGIALVVVFAALMIVLVTRKVELLDLLFTVGLLVAGTVMVMGDETERTSGIVALVGGLCLVRLRTMSKQLEQLRKAGAPTGSHAASPSVPGSTKRPDEGAEAKSRSQSKD